MLTRRSAFQSRASQALTPAGVPVLVVVWPPGELGEIDGVEVVVNVGSKEGPHVRLVDLELQHPRWEVFRATHRRPPTACNLKLDCEPVVAAPVWGLTMPFQPVVLTALGTFNVHTYTDT
jgi:hypothetical protein